MLLARTCRGQPGTLPVRHLQARPSQATPHRAAAVRPVAASASADASPDSERAAHNARQAALFDATAALSFLEPAPPEVEEVRKRERE